MVLGWSSAENALFVKLGDSVSVIAEQFTQNFVAVLSAFGGFARNRKFAPDDFDRIRQHVRTKDLFGDPLHAILKLGIVLH